MVRPPAARLVLSVRRGGASALRVGPQLAAARRRTDWPAFDNAGAATTAHGGARWRPRPLPPPGAWVDPVDGGCPSRLPGQGQHGSRIYHVPGGQFYERTVPERCYTDPQAAEADGYRAARR